MNTFHAISKKIPVEGMDLINFYRYINLSVGPFWHYEASSLGTITKVQDLGHNLFMVETNNHHVFYVWQVVKNIPKKCLNG